MIAADRSISLTLPKLHGLEPIPASIHVSGSVSELTAEDARSLASALVAKADEADSVNALSIPHLVAFVDSLP